jgi:hypothetical protein
MGRKASMTLDSEVEMRIDPEDIVEAIKPSM